MKKGAAMGAVARNEGPPRPSNGSIRLGDQMMKRIVLLGSATLMAMGATPAAAQFKAALDTAEATIREGAQSQQRVEQLDDQASELLGQFRALNKQLELNERYNVSRARQVEDQQLEVQGLQRDLENIEGVKRAVTPLMEEMIEDLAAMIEADVPFLPTERQERLERLRAVMADSSQNEASRFGLILEAFEIEAEYGRTSGVYKGTVEADGQALEVDFLRIGRVLLAYKTSDDSLLRIYDKDQGAFVDLDRRFLPNIRSAMRVADKKAAPSLLEIPVSAPVSAGGAQ